MSVLHFFAKAPLPEEWDTCIFKHDLQTGGRAIPHTFPHIYELAAALSTLPFLYIGDGSVRLMLQAEQGTKGQSSHPMNRPAISSYAANNVLTNRLSLKKTEREVDNLPSELHPDSSIGEGIFPEAQFLGISFPAEAFLTFVPCAQPQYNSADVGQKNGLCGAELPRNRQR